MAQKILLFLGAGGNVGASSLKMFKSKGYKIASVARTIREEVKAQSDIVISVDLTDPKSVEGVFKKVEEELGIPNVVVYNPFSWSMGPEPEDPTSASVSDFQKDLAINTTSAFATAKAAVSGFDKLPSSVKKTFIYTGNAGNICILPSFFMLGIGKVSGWYMIQTLVATQRFASRGYRFYYVDERTPEGKAMHHTSGRAHAEFFLELAERNEQGEPLATFVRGKGYVKFETSDVASLPRRSLEDVLDPGFGAPGNLAGRYPK